MKLDIKTLAFIQSLTFVTQVIVLFVQYKVNKTHKEIKWCIWGSAVMALGVIFMILIAVKPLEILARIANPLVVFGQILLYVGIMQFLEKKENRGVLTSIFTVFILTYFSFMYIANDLSARTVAIHTTLAAISMITAYQLFPSKDKPNAGSAYFTAAVFFVYGCFLLTRALLALLLPPMHTYSDQETILTLGMIVPVITSNLWTFGIIIMLNQRLNAENLLEKEKLQLIFNTSPDAAMITRLHDGLIIDVNNGFSVITGYAREEVIGDSTININLWHNVAERNIFVLELEKQGICEEMEFLFERKEGSQFVGMISSRILIIYDVPHIVSSIRDITERKKAEEQIQQLVQQLETERNTAQQNSITDSLTGLANRRYFDEALKIEVGRLKRSGSVISLLMLDIDYFKNFNDSYGHLAGDDCLREIASTFKKTVERASDIVARYGGEEFVVILPETGEDGAIVLAEQIRKAVEDLAIVHSTSTISKYVTVSIGIVSAYSAELTTPEQVLAQADQALYCAKNWGRNRMVTASECIS